MLVDLFTDTTGRERFLYGLIGPGINLALFYFLGLVWFWLWAVSGLLTLSAAAGEWSARPKPSS
ncbi:hypothetical protein V2O64_22345 [Verrucomicrobiaceae bacterium 227]